MSEFWVVTANSIWVKIPLMPKGVEHVMCWASHRRER